MATSEEYLREHNIKSVSLITEGTSAPVLLIKINDEVLRVHMTQGMISNISDLDEIISDTVYDYEQNKKMEDM